MCAALTRSVRRTGRVADRQRPPRGGAGGGRRRGARGPGGHAGRAGAGAGRPGRADRPLDARPDGDRRCHGGGRVRRGGRTQGRDDVDYIGVGPVHATPTKPGRPAVGWSSSATPPDTRGCRSSRSAGSTRTTFEATIEAGARRVAVVRAIADAADPEQAAHALSRTSSSRELRCTRSRSEQRDAQLAGAAALTPLRRGRAPDGAAGRRRGGRPARGRGRGRRAHRPRPTPPRWLRSRRHLPGGVLAALAWGCTGGATGRCSASRGCWPSRSS